MRGLLRWFLLALALAGAARAQRLQTWCLEHARFQPGPGATDAPMAVGSLQKPFVAQAWAVAHPGEAAPRLACTPRSGCWLHQGHGEIGLARATALSCNAYFRQLAAATPLEVVNAHLRRAGFQGSAHSAEAAIGLPDGQPPLLIRPSVLLMKYNQLINSPWIEGEPLRRQLLAGLREAAFSGTASALKRRGCWAKTGTVPFPGNPLQTCGLALAVEDGGGAVLARLEPGTGREAAAALGTSGFRPSPGEDTPGTSGVTVQLFELLRPRGWRVRNLGLTSIPSSRGGFLGPGGTQDLVKDDWVGPGLLEIEALGTGLHRRVEALVRCPGRRTLLATMGPREYTQGVLAAELPGATESRRIELGAAVQRFLARGPRHPEADVCDSTHCAWFIGRGPRVEWPRGDRVVLGGAPPEPTLSDSEWLAMVELARRPGPSHWTSHCGGHPLSAHALWGGDDRAIQDCGRHGAGQSRPWQRTWRAQDLERAFGEPVSALAVTLVEGVWGLMVVGSRSSRTFTFDEAHRRLASVLGWGALPSPADGVEPVPGGFRASGVGLGHRVGLCLGE